MDRINIKTTSREQMIPILQQLTKAASEHGWRDGLLLVHCPHTTAAVTINESADPDVRRDMTGFMREMVPDSAAFQHVEGNSDAHIKSSLFGQQTLLIVQDGEIRLGPWQEVYFCEWDGPRNRELWLIFTPDAE